MFPTESVTSARSVLATAVHDLASSSDQLFYDQRYCKWRDREIQISLLSHVIAQLDHLLEQATPRLVLPVLPQRKQIPARSSKRSRQ